MKTLCSKIQLKNFEVGEFGEIANRTLDETLNLIFSFPWATERALASVELHCPSVTIESLSGSYLKVGPYFNGKFCIYHCSKSGKVTFQVLNELNEMIAIIAEFFNGKIKIAGFQNYKYVVNPRKYFKTNPYEYKPGAKAIFNYFKLDLLIIVAPLCILGTKFFTDWSVITNPLGLFAILIFLLFFCGPSLYLLLDYQPYTKNQFLKISRGHHHFIFGDIAGNKEYDKSDIVGICRYYNHGGRNPWSGSQVYRITFKNGEMLLFNSLLIDQWAFIKKFPGLEIKSKHVFFPTVNAVLSN